MIPNHPLAVGYSACFDTLKGILMPHQYIDSCEGENSNNYNVFSNILCMKMGRIYGKYYFTKNKYFFEMCKISYTQFITVYNTALTPVRALG